MFKFVENIIKFSLKNYITVLFLTGLLVIGGIVAINNTLIEAYPDVTNTRARIITQWPGRSAEEIEKFITLPITREMNTIPGKTEVRSVSLFGLSVVTVGFKDEIDDFYAQQYASNRMRNVELPDDADAEIEPPSGATGEIFRYLIRSDNKPIRELAALQEWVIEPELLAVDGIADIVSFGGEEKTYEVRVNPVELANFGLTALDVYDAISHSNINVGGDVIEKGNQAYVVRGVGLLDKISDIEDIMIDNINGTPILVKNVAEVIETGKPRLGQVGFNDEDDLIQGIIVMLRGENPNKVIERVKERIEDLNERILPDGVYLEPFIDRTDLVNTTIKTVSTNLVEGILLVSIIVFIFLFNWRTTVIVATVIPLSFLFALIMLRVQGLSANLISIGAIDFGLLLEGTLVIVEHIFVGLDRKAKEKGMKEFNLIPKDNFIATRSRGVAKSILFAQLILIIALLPIFSFQKVEGKMFAPLAFTLGYALLGSLILSLTYVPVLCKLLLNKNVREKRNPINEFFKENLFKIYTFTAKNRKGTIAVFCLIFLLSALGFSKLGSEFIPKLNEGAIYIRATLPNSINLKESVRLTQEMKEKIREYNEVDFVLTQTGRPNDGTDPTGFFNIEFHVELKPIKEWTKGVSLDELINDIEKDLSIYPGIELAFSQPIMDNVEEYVAGVKSALVVKIFGNDLYTLEKEGEKVAKLIERVDGVEDINLFRNIGLSELRIRLSEAKMARYGVKMDDAQAVVEMAIGGKAVSSFYEGDRKFDIRLRYAEEYRKSEEEIKNILVPTGGDNKVPLEEIADIGFFSGPAFVYREGNSRYIAVGFSIRGRDLGSTIKEAQALVEANLNLPKSYKLEWAGEFESQQRATKRLFKIVPLSLLLITFLLYIYFNNFLDTSLALLTLPLAFVGGYLSLLISNTIFGISAGVGFIILFGVGTIDGIILITVIKEYIKKGMTLRKAIEKGIYDRIRPILMIALMGSLGLLPAALSQGMGSEIQKPLAIVIVGGLTIGMFFSLFVLPHVFYYAYKNKASKGKLQNQQ